MSGAVFHREAAHRDPDADRLPHHAAAGGDARARFDQRAHGGGQHDGVGLVDLAGQQRRARRHQLRAGRHHQHPLPRQHGQLTEAQRLTVNRARKIQQFLGQPFHVAEVFTGVPGVYVKLEDTIRSFAAIIDGECDEIPEQAFRNKGAIEDVYAAYEKMKAEQE